MGFISKVNRGYHARLVDIVQGRITNGTLFPNISIKISGSMNALVRKTFEDLRGKAEAVLDLVRNDIDMALASGRQSSGSGHEDRDEEEDELRKELSSVVEGLKGRHAEVLEGLSGL